MRLGFTLFLTGATLKGRKLRSFLTIGGMSVGVGVVVFLVSLGFGLQLLIKSRITNVEALTVLDVTKGESTLLELNDEVVEKFQAFESVQNVSPSLSLSGQAVAGDAATDVAIYGIDPTFIELEGLKIAFGSQFSSSEAKEIIITSTAVNLIGFANAADAVGKAVTLKIIVPEKLEGTEEETLVTKELAVTVAGVVQDEELTIVYAPLAVLQSVGIEPDYSLAKVKVDMEKLKEYSLARIKVEDQSKLPEVRQKIESMGYEVNSIADTVGQIDKIFLVFEFVLAGFGAIALFVAAIGSLNTLTVSLLERTREIGLMKTLGATSGDIYRLFLVESITISVLGGAIGTLLGIGLGEGVNAGLNYVARQVGGEQVDIFATPAIFIVVVMTAALLVGVVTGYYPARRAATINPLDALRYE